MSKEIRVTFEKILRQTRYKINRDIMETVLSSMDFKIHDNCHKLSAYKRVNDYRIHVEIDLFPDGEIHKESEFRIHIDSGFGSIFHSIKGKEYVHPEFQVIQTNILHELRERKKREKRLKRKHILKQRLQGPMINDNIKYNIS